MQMSRLYQTTNKQIRAAQHFKDAEECKRAGFHDFARINYELGAMLSPREEEWDPSINLDNVAA